MSPDYIASPAGPAFADEFGRLVALLRGAPLERAAQEAALRSATRAIAETPAFLEAGVEDSTLSDELSLKSRLLARRVDWVRVAAGAPEDELLAFAIALAEDDLAVPSTARVQVELIPIFEPLDSASAVMRMSGSGSQSEFDASAPRRVRIGDGIGDSMTDLGEALTRAIRHSAWGDALHAAQAIIRMVPAMPEAARRTYAIAIRRLLNRDVLRSLIEFAFRIPEEQARTGEVLAWSGLDGAEVMLETVRHLEAIGPRAFLFDALGQMPEALPLITPMLHSSRWYEVRHAVDLLGRLGQSQAIEPLKATLSHPDERVRAAVIESLGRFQDRIVVEPLRQALTNPSSVLRVQAARALARRRSGALAMPLLAALEVEKDPTAWKELLMALAAIEAPEASSALVRLATDRKSLLGRGGRTLNQRLDVVAALGAGTTSTARHALERIALEGDEVVRDAARKALGLEA